MDRVQVLVATVDQKDGSIAERMNLHSDAIIANQADEDRMETIGGADVLLITSKTRGAGTNRNIALDHASGDIVVFADDDFVFRDGFRDVVAAEFERTGADVIFFNYLYHSADGSVRERVRRPGRVRIYNGLKYGACGMAARLGSIREHDLHFSSLFGGGSLYGSGEDSLFLTECLRRGLKVWASDKMIGDNHEGGSTWFTGYNDKYFHDIGAWTACAFPKSRQLMKWYFVFRYAGETDLPVRERVSMLKKGISNYGKRKGYDQE